MPVCMDVPMEMVVHHTIMFMGMRVKMFVKMAVLMLVLQGPDGLAAALPECIG